MKCPNCNKEVKVIWIRDKNYNTSNYYWQYANLDDNEEEDLAAEDIMTMDNDYLEDCRDLHLFDFCYNCDTAIT